MMDANILLALHNIKRIVDDVTRQVLSNYTIPEDPVIRFLEYGLGMIERDVKRAHWLALYYKGTPQVFTLLEEFAYPVKAGNSLYYLQYIKFSSIEWYINEYYHGLDNGRTTNVVNDEIIYISQNVAVYNLKLAIKFVNTRVTPSVFVQYLVEYAMHMILFNNIDITIDNVNFVLDSIRIVIDRIYRAKLTRRYVMHKLVQQYY